MLNELASVDRAIKNCDQAGGQLAYLAATKYSNKLSRFPDFPYSQEDRASDLLSNSLSKYISAFGNTTPLEETFYS